MSGRVGVAIDGHVATVTLTRPDKHNALDVEMFDAILAAAARLRDESGVRAVVLHGEGPSFCSGPRRRLDHAVGTPPGPRLGRSPTASAATCPTGSSAPRTTGSTLPMPVIAALHGSVLGGGLQIALGADIRIAAPDARLSVMEVKWGLIPDMGITRTLPRLVSIDVAKELTYTGRTVSGRGGGDARARDPGQRRPARRRPRAGRSGSRRARRTRCDAPSASTRARGPAKPRETLALEAELQLSWSVRPTSWPRSTAGFSGEPAEFTDS